MSLNHRDIEDISNSRAARSMTSTDGKPCIVKTPEQVRVSRETQVSIGQGEGDTR